MDMVSIHLYTKTHLNVHLPFSVYFKNTVDYFKFTVVSRVGRLHFFRIIPFSYHRIYNIIVIS